LIVGCFADINKRYNYKQFVLFLVFPSFVEGMREKTQLFGKNWQFSRK